MPEYDFRTIVGSTYLESCRYDEDTATLEVRFRKSPGRTYAYRGVPAHEYRELINHPRPGQHFRDRIKSRYTAERRGK